MLLRIILCFSYTRDIYEINIFQALYICFPRNQNQSLELDTKFCSLEKKKVVSYAKKKKKKLVVSDAS